MDPVPRVENLTCIFEEIPNRGFKTTVTFDVTRTITNQMTINVVVLSSDGQESVLHTTRTSSLPRGPHHVTFNLILSGLADLASVGMQFFYNRAQFAQLDFHMEATENWSQLPNKEETTRDQGSDYDSEEEQPPQPQQQQQPALHLRRNAIFDVEEGRRDSPPHEEIESDGIEDEEELI
ncbi:unnamed protein product [Caenorhabditis nigoni]